MTKRSASFTSFSLRKARLTSGSRGTRFVPERYALAYLPRIPFRNSSPRSYSGRNSSLDLPRGFFIGPSFASSQFPCADNSYRTATVRVGDHNQPLLVGSSEGYVPELVTRVIWIRCRNA